MDINLIIPSLALGVQLISIFFTIRLVRYMEQRVVGIICALMVSLMAFRRVISVDRLISQASVKIEVFDLVGFSVSLLILYGIILITRAFKSAEEHKNAAIFSETRYWTLFNQSPDGILLMNAKGDIVDFNEAVNTQLGYTREEFSKMRISDIDPIESPAGISARFENALKEGKGEFEVKHKTKQGDIRDVHVKIQRMELSGQMFFHAICRDITERIYAEENLKAYEAMVTAMTEGLALIKPSDGIIVYANPNFERLFGYARGELNGKPASVLNATGPESPEQTAARIQQILRTEGTWSGTLQNCKKDGSTFWSQASVTLLEHPLYGKVWLSVHMDITKRVEAEQLLVDSRNTLRALLDAPTDNLILIDRHGTILDASKEMERRLHASREELLGSSAWKWLPPDVAATRKAYADQVCQTGQSVRFEDQRGDSWYDNVYFPVLDEHRRITGLVVLARDITERKRAENTIKANEEKLRAILTVLPTGISVLDDEYAIVDMNPELAKILDISPEGLLKGWYRNRTYLRSDGSFKPANEFPSHIAHCEQRAVMNDITGVVKENGEIVWTSVNAAPLIGSGVVLSTTNITERMKTEEELACYRQKLEAIVFARTERLNDVITQLYDEIMARATLTEKLRQSELFLTNILNSIQDGICVLDNHRRIMLVNNAVAKWVPEAWQFGFRTHTCEDLFFKFVLCDDHAAHSVRTGGRVPLMLLRGEGEDGRKWFEVKSYPLNTKEGRVIGCVYYIRDVTNAKIMEKRIAQYEGQLRALHYEMSALENRQQRRIAQELHDSIPQTLAFCKMRLETIEQGCPTLSSYADSFQEIYGFLDTSIAEARSLIFKLAPPVLYELGLEPAIEQLLRQLEKSHPIDFVFVGCGHGAPMKGDVVAIIYGMVRELITNCVKHSGASNVSISVSRDDDLIIQVRDNGRGIDPEKVAQRTQMAGGGYGLFSIRERVRHMDGVFTIENCEEGGACATICVPLLRKHETANSQRQVREES